MLIEIRCDKFKEKVVTFHAGLNVVLGDEKATNSIGKSTLLMVLDYAFGGNSFTKHNSDVTDELGHHEYFFTFEFDKIRHTFKRGTNQPKLIYRCSAEFEEIEPISIIDYTAFLKAGYKIDIADITFRACVSLFSRVWGKENYSVKKPLHDMQAQKSQKCVDNLLKIFGRYDSIKNLSIDLESVHEERKALSDAFKRKLIPKIGKKQYAANTTEISRIESEIADIKQNLAKYATNIGEIVNKEILELKVQKDELLSTKNDIEAKLLRVKSNLAHNRYIKSKHLKSLIDFFPQVNIGKLTEIEDFHSSLSGILRKELMASEKELNSQVSLVTTEITRIDASISGALSAIDNPTYIVDRVYELSNSLCESRSENEYYETEENLRERLNDTKRELSNEKQRVLELVENVINEKIRKFVTDIYDQHRKSPELSLRENNYSYEVFEDTGTGKAYSNLIILDLAVFAMTKLPVIIHDSMLFKNIENDAVANLIELYTSFEKQSFIAIDEIEKYGVVAKSKLIANRVIQLDNDNVLYIEDWRKKRAKKT